jgi:hypothetical protein
VVPKRTYKITRKTKGSTLKDTYHFDVRVSSENETGREGAQRLVWVFENSQLPQEMKEFMLLSDKYMSKVRTLFLCC